MTIEINTTDITNFTFDSRILSSSHINFLFGAGVNGDAFPQMSGFNNTTTLLESYLGHKITFFEDDIEELTHKNKVEKVYTTFINEFKIFEKEIKYNDKSIIDIESLFHKVNRLLLESENRTITTKQVNVYTLNYDGIIENVLRNMGLLTNVVSSSNIDNHDKFFDLVGYNYNLKKYIPTYLISKIHGDIQSPILPGKSKYDDALAAKRFEILFRMKSQLSRMNSVLLIIGYSGKDKHINRLLKDCISAGLTIYWFRFQNSETIPIEMIDKVTVIDQPNKDQNQNMSKVCSTLIGEIWEE